MKFKLLFLSCAVLIMGSPLQAMEWSQEDDDRKAQRKIDQLIDRDARRIARDADKENLGSNPQATAIDESPNGNAAGIDGVVPQTKPASPSTVAVDVKDDSQASAKPLTPQQQKRAQKKREQAEAQARLAKTAGKKRSTGQAPQATSVEEKKEDEKPSPEATALEIEKCKRGINGFIDNPLHLLGNRAVGRLTMDERRVLEGLQVIDAQTDPGVFVKVRVKMFTDKNNNLPDLKALQALLYGIEDQIQATIVQKMAQRGRENEAERAKKKQEDALEREATAKAKDVNPNVVKYSEFSDGVTKNLTDKLETQLDEETINSLAAGHIDGEHYIKGGCYRQEILHFANHYRIYFRRGVVINGRAKLVLLLFEKKTEQDGIATRADGAFERFCHERGLDPNKYLDKR